MTLLSRGLCAAVLILAVAAASASAATVTVRVEGATKTLLPSTKVTVPDSGQIPDAESGCEWGEHSGPLEATTGGNWSRATYVTEILDEAYTDTANDRHGWYSWTGHRYGGGICFTAIEEGAEILFTASRFDKADYNPDDLPLYLRDVPARAEKGKPFTVSVVKAQPSAGDDAYYDPGTGELVPAEGVVVQIGSATATTDAAGKATITVQETGQLQAQARTVDNGAGRSALTPVCVSCDPAAPVQGEAAAPAGEPLAPCLTSGTDGLCGSIDREAPRALVTGIAEGEVFGRGRGPRELTGRVGEPSGLHAVKLRLTRRVGGRCSAWSGSKERFVRRRCGARHGWWFRIGDRADWSYLLPARLPRGRYVLDVNAIDRAYNRDDRRRRGENRVVFRVR